MKDRENTLRRLDEVDNMVMILQQTVERNMPIDREEAISRLREIRRRLQFVTDRVTAS
jgi:tetrahydromethanopterin S-methyltransferase subunit G